MHLMYSKNKSGHKYGVQFVFMDHSFPCFHGQPDGKFFHGRKIDFPDLLEREI